MKFGAAIAVVGVLTVIALLIFEDKWNMEFKRYFW